MDRGNCMVARANRRAIPRSYPRVDKGWFASIEVCAKRVFEKSHAGAIRLSIRRIAARSIIASEVCTRYS
jgi:hypothetical protein